MWLLLLRLRGRGGRNGRITTRVGERRRGGQAMSEKGGWDYGGVGTVGAEIDGTVLQVELMSVSVRRICNGS